MKFESVKYVRRIPKETYGFEEIEVTVSLNEDEDLYTSLEEIRKNVEGKSITAVEVVPESTTERELKEVLVKSKPKKESKKEPKKDSKEVPAEFMYNRTNALHRKDFVEIANNVSPDWDKDMLVSKVIGGISRKLHGSRMYLKKDVVIESFVEEFTKLFKDESE